MKLILLSFATIDLSRSIKRFVSQANYENYYDKIIVKTPQNLSLDVKNKIKFFLKKGKKRGYAYWYWKPLLLLETLTNMDSNDIVHYLDIGFHIKKDKNNRLNDYLNFIKSENNWILPFQYNPLNTKNIEDISFPEREEYKYSKADLINYFNLKDDKIVDTAQFSAGNIFIKKTSRAIQFVKEWLSVFENQFNLVDDTISEIKNHPNFVENRHDQSVFSLLCKTNHIKSFSAYEFDWAIKHDQRTWDHNLDYPFLAKRDLKYNLLRRFINRQIKSYRRLKKKFISLYLN